MSEVTSFKPRLVAHARLHFDTIEKRYMLLFPEAAMALNETGPEIIKLCDGKRSVDDIVQTLAKAFDIAPQEIAGDVLEFIEALRLRGLMEAA